MMQIQESDTQLNLLMLVKSKRHAISVHLQGCAIILRLEIALAANACNLLDHQSLFCLYRILKNTCHLEHFHTLASAAEIHMLRQKMRFEKLIKTRNHSIFQLGLKEIALWQGKPPSSPQSLAVQVLLCWHQHAAALSYIYYQMLQNELLATAKCKGERGNPKACL